MIITENVTLGRIISGTWKLSVFNFFTCLASWAMYNYIVRHHFEFPTILPTLLGTALAFAVGFHNNQAYDRWWEGRIIWGAIVNESRTWARQCIQYIADDTQRSLVRTLVLRHLAFVHALRENLRMVNDHTYQKYLSDEEITHVERSSNKHNAILDLQSASLGKAYTTGIIDGFRFIELNKSLTALCNEMAKAERIKNTVFPTTYNYYSRMFIWLLTASVTMVLTDSIGPWSIMFGFLVGYVFSTIHEIGNALLNPFVMIPTGIPLDQITRTIEINVLEMLGDKKIPGPIQPIKGEYVM
jgi:ion channel-forming bestrophin family protein